MLPGGVCYGEKPRFSSRQASHFFPSPQTLVKILQIWSSGLCIVLLMIRLVKPSGFGICGCVGIWRTGLEGSFPLGPVSCEVASSEQAGLGGSFVVEPVSCEQRAGEAGGFFCCGACELRACEQRTGGAVGLFCFGASELASSEQAGLEGSFAVEPVSCELAGSKQAGLVGSLCAGGAGGLLRIEGFCEFRNLRIQNCRIA